MGQFDFTDIVFYQMSVKNTVKVGLKEVAQKHGQDMCHAIPFLHALTGSDTTSAFWGIGKKKGYDILKSYTPAVATFGSFFNEPFQNINVEMESFKIIQRFVILMYSKTSDHKSINKARMDMFFLKNHPNIESIPPTENNIQNEPYFKQVFGVGGMIVFKIFLAPPYMVGNDLI